MLSRKMRSIYTGSSSKWKLFDIKNYDIFYIKLTLIKIHTAVYSVRVHISISRIPHNPYLSGFFMSSFEIQSVAEYQFPLKQAYYSIHHD